MYAILIGLVGILFGAVRAKRRGGTAADMVAWGLGHGFAFVALTVFVLAVFYFFRIYVF
ncbi:hypothetical protein [Roseobacter sp. HKCCA0434]|uniref:hypothetical protein n=1 Tax=Roseobacter sp. HKCCA0434 TaxID=3079297 RepID=UPI00290593F9|nr:hypothetical protein [Roseobacter sp. HKCCA0434]